MLTIAVDAMGGDHAPKSEVEGAIQRRPLARRQGDSGRAGRCGSQRTGSAYAAPRTCPSRSSTPASRSPWRTARPRRSGPSGIPPFAWLRGWCAKAIAQGVVSAGNTGAVMATAKMVQGMIPRRGPSGAGLRVSDAEGHAGGGDGRRRQRRLHRREMLAQFAVMGEIYSRIIFRKPGPRVGLLSIGEEEHKGNELTRAATPLLKALPINFIGNVEGRDIYTGDDRRDRVRRLYRQRGAEGQRRPGGHDLQDAAGVARRPRSRARSATCCRGTAFQDFRKRVDYSEYGGAPLLGVKGVCIICHGRSNANAIKNAIRVAAEFAAGQDQRADRSGAGGRTHAPNAAQPMRIGYLASCSCAAGAARRRARSGAMDAHASIAKSAARVDTSRSADRQRSSRAGTLLADHAQRRTRFRPRRAIAENPAVAGFKVYQPKPERKFDPNLQTRHRNVREPGRSLVDVELKKDAPAGPLELTARSAIRPATTRCACRRRSKTGFHGLITSIRRRRSAAIAIPAGYTEVTPGRDGGTLPPHLLRCAATSAPFRWLSCSC